jgi:hypothetical protein
MRVEDIRRGARVSRPSLEHALFGRVGYPPAEVPGPGHQEVVRDLSDRLRRAERKLAAIEAIGGIDAAALRAATSHTCLLCLPSGYELLERDEPPPAGGDVVELRGSEFRVERLAPSPLPADPRRCAILVNCGTGH